MDRKGVGHWFMTLVLAAAIWAVSFFNMMETLRGEGASVALSFLELFLAGWGFVYGALVLSGVAPQKGSSPVPPRQEGQGRGVAASALAVACSLVAGHGSLASGRHNR